MFSLVKGTDLHYLNRVQIYILGESTRIPEDHCASGVLRTVRHLNAGEEDVRGKYVPNSLCFPGGWSNAAVIEPGVFPVNRNR